MVRMKKMKYFAALFGIFMAAAVSVTACAGQGKGTEAVSEAGTEDRGTENSSAADPSEAGNQAAGAAKFGTLEAAGAGGTVGSGDAGQSGPAQPITGAAPADGEVLSGIPVDAGKSEAVSIYYGAVCYSFFSEEKEKIKEVADLFTGFSLEEVTDGQLEEATTYQIYFSTDTEQIAAINVDKNGVFYIPEEKKFYRIKAGTFHFEELDRIYKDSMYQDGFDENQCLLQ